MCPKRVLRRRRTPAAPRPERIIYVDAEKSEVPQTATRPAQRKGLARRLAGVWRIWAEGSRASLDHRPADRSRARGHHSLHQARRKIVDPHFPGQALYQKARG